MCLLSLKLTLSTSRTVLTSSACFILGKSTPCPSTSETETHMSRHARCTAHIVHYFHSPVCLISTVWSYSEGKNALYPSVVLVKHHKYLVAVFFPEKLPESGMIQQATFPTKPIFVQTSLSKADRFCDDLSGV